MCYISFALSIVLQNVEKNEDNNVNCILVRNSYQGCRTVIIHDTKRHAHSIPVIL